MNEAELISALRSMIGMPAAEFLQHRKPMLLLDTLTDIGIDSASCEWTMGDSPFARPDGRVPAYTGIEHMAQCVAVHSGARARVRGLGPPLGFLLGTRHFRTSISTFAPGATYIASCRELVRDSQGMGSFACELHSDNERIASANLAVLEHPQD